MQVGRCYAFQWDRKTGVAVRSEESRAILGLGSNGTLRDVRGAFLTLLHPEDRPKLVAAVRALTPADPTYSLRLRLQRPDGQDVVLRETARGVFDNRGRLLSLAGMAADETAQARAEEALRHLNAELEERVAEQVEEIHHAFQVAKTERQRLYDVLETLPAYVVLLSKDYHVPFANRFFRERFGESHGRCCFQHRFQRSEPCENCETYKVLKTNAPLNWQWTGPDGRDYDIYDFPFTDSDGSPMILEMGIDITERNRARQALQEAHDTLEQRVAERAAAELRASEEAVRRAKEEWERTFNTVPDLIAILDREHRVVRVNRAMAARVGKTPQECIGVPCYLAVHGTDGPPDICPHAQTCADGREHTVELREPRLGGDFLVTTTPLLDGQGRHVGSVHVARDITLLRKAQDALSRQNAVLDGISRIFREAIVRHSEEELGRACLDVAVSLTDSQFGFIGEVRPDGLLHDIAIDETGWSECAMADKAGHRRPPGRFKLHGLYGRVVRDGRSLLANEPAGRPDSVGVPPGHPPLRSFLGVPLLREGRAVALIAVANREGGYRREDQEALEALAPAAVEALARRRAEAEVESLASFPRENPNPTLRISREGVALRANPAAEWLLAARGSRPPPSSPRTSPWWTSPSATWTASASSRT